MSDEWDDVFALAQGHGGNSSEKRASDCKNDPIEKKKRRKATIEHSRNNDRLSVCRSYLDGRMSNDIIWPTWLSLGRSFLSNVCTGWSENLTNGSFVGKGATCGRCGRRSDYHIASLANEIEYAHQVIGSMGPSWPLHLFCDMRNLRCAAICAIRDDVQLSKRMIERLDDAWEESLSMASQAWQSLPGRLKEPCRDVAPRIRQGLKFNSKNSMAMERTVGLIMACDSVYYQLYYAQITSQLPTPCAGASSSDLFIPHPLSFFALIAVDVDEGDHPEPFVSSVDAAARTLISDRFGLDVNLQQHDESTLALLHRYRSLETCLLFHGWAAHSTVREQTISQLVAEKDIHETPAPKILMSWRDHGRDFLCHLYSYVTLPRLKLQRLVDTFVKNNIRTVLELGAGTGYIAALLSNIGLKLDVHLKIEAFDLNPPNAVSRLNEYHGNTPPFGSVQRGSEAILCNRGGSLSNTALLLCYPPPKNPMAYQALKNFTERNGQVFVFMGEFKGLTGSDKFESLLVNNYVCVYRSLTLCWGTDASFVTVWRRRWKQEDSVDKPLLLPCCLCGRVESKKRFRLLRCLSYCSKRCFELHTEVRRAALKLVMLDLGPGSLDVEWTRCFSDI